MNQIYSIVRRQEGHQKISIESKLNKGLPRASIIGLKDSLAKESLIKMKSAILNQGFEWALDKHLVISLKENEDKAGDALLGLGLVLSKLLETDQLKIEASKKVVAVGELDLDGRVKPLSLLENGLVPKKDEVWLGNFTDGEQKDGSFIDVKKVSDLNNLVVKAHKITEPEKGVKSFTKRVENLSPEWTELFEVLVHGEHSALFLSPEDPELLEFVKLVRENLYDLSPKQRSGVRMQSGKRPLVSINPAATRNQILGLGNAKGFYHYANGGVVYLDGFLNFSKQVREAVRSKVSGGAFFGEEKLRAVLIAQNSLCPCGKAKVGKPRKCSFSLYKCRAVLEKLSIDELSTFQIVLAPVKNWMELYPHPDLDVDHLNKRRRLAKETLEKRGQAKPNSELYLLELKEMMSKTCRELSYIPNLGGLDRTKSILSVSRTFADLEGSVEIEAEHIEKSVELTYKVAKEVAKSF